MGDKYNRPIDLLSSALSEEGPGGTFITEEELSEMTALARGSEAMIEHAAYLANERTDGAVFSESDLDILTETYGEKGRRFVKELKANCDWPKNLKIFQEQRGTCEGRVNDELSYLKNKLGIECSPDSLCHYYITEEPFKQDIHSAEFQNFAMRLQKAYPPSDGWGSNDLIRVMLLFGYQDRTALFNPSFVDFAADIKRTYGMNALENFFDARSIFSSPTLVPAIRDPKVIEIYKFIVDDLGLETKLTEDGIIFLKALSVFDDWKERIGRLKDVYLKLVEAYGDAVVISRLSEFVFMNNILTDERTTFLLSEKAVSFFEMVRDHTDYHFFTGDPSLVAITLLEFEGLAGQFDALKKEPDAKQLLKTLDDMFRSKDLICRLSEDSFKPVLIRNYRSIKDNYPKIKINLGYYPNDLARPDLRLLLSSEYFDEMYDTVTKLIPGQKIPQEVFFNFIFKGDLFNKAKDDEFVRKSRDVIDRFFEASSSNNEWETLFDVMQNDLSDIETMLSDEALENYNKLKDAGFKFSEHDLYAFSRLIKTNDIPQLIKLVQDMGIQRDFYDVGSLWQISELTDRLKDPRTRTFIKETLEQIKMKNVFQDTLISLIELSKLDKAAAIVDRLAAIGFDLEGSMYNWSESQRLISFLKKNAQKITDRELLNGWLGFKEEFMLTDRIDLNDLTAMADNSEIFTLKKEKLRGLLDFMKRNFGINKFESDMFPAISKLVDEVDIQAMTDVIKGLGLKTELADIFLLNLTGRNKALRDKIKDREGLLKAAQEIYSRPSLRRTDMMNEDKNYTERPDLGTIDNLNLLRLVMLKEALKDEKTLSEIGRIVSKDLADQKTEYGGQVLWNNGKIKFNNVKAQEWSNNSYSNDLNIFLRGGLMTFHLHATQENDSPYAGPSGHWSGTGLGDWKVAAYSGHVDVVITAAGYTDSSKKAMRVNVDMYYVRDGRPFVIDLGIYEVTVTSLP